ncbi:alanine racemase [Motiliproteus sediminis]|uniref:alanine racemase n=1 Tax=Motiliproteus sediminis TaxID=1468178 RepID=UPI001AEF42CB|nr:alanine racemase [Motiliproteus sediminis]
MARPAKAVINLAAIRHNYRLAKELAPHSRALAVVKGNGYGHGAVEVAQTLAPQADAFAVACIEEAEQLRAAGIDHRLVLLEGIFDPSELPKVDQLGLDLVIHSDYQIDALLDYTPRHPLNLWLKMDSGMHRLGFSPDAFLEAYKRLHGASQAGEITLMSHFARADELDQPRTREQLELFLRFSRALDLPISLSNSPAVLAWPETHQQWVRPGMMLYGASPLDRATATSAQLEPAMTLSSAIIAVQHLKAGDSIGYGNRYSCTRPTRVGVVAMGYADGFPRHAPNGLPVLIGEHDKSSLIGRVSMDMLTVDITDIDDADVGTEVTFWGRGLPIELIAEQCGTIPYELVTNLTPRIPRLYVDCSNC